MSRLNHLVRLQRTIEISKGQSKFQVINLDSVGKIDAMKIHQIRITFCPNLEADGLFVLVGAGERFGAHEH